MYSPGVGTGPSKLDMLTGGAFGEGLDQVSFSSREQPTNNDKGHLTKTRIFVNVTISHAPTTSMGTRSFSSASQEELLLPAQ